MSNLHTKVTAITAFITYGQINKLLNVKYAETCPLKAIAHEGTEWISEIDCLQKYLQEPRAGTD